MILKDRYFKFKVLSGLSFINTLQKLSVLPRNLLILGAEYAPQIIFKTAAAILVVVQRLLSYKTCRGFLILWLDNSSRLLHLPGLIVLAGSKSRGMLVLAGDFLSCKQLIAVLYLLGKENDSRPNTKPWLSA